MSSPPQKKKRKETDKNISLVKKRNVTLKAKLLQALEITTESVCESLHLFLCAYIHMSSQKIFSIVLCGCVVIVAFSTHPFVVIHPGCCTNGQNVVSSFSLL